MNGPIQELKLLSMLLEICLVVLLTCMVIALCMKREKLFHRHLLAFSLGFQIDLITVGGLCGMRGSISI